MPLPAASVDIVIETLLLKPGSVFYDLGSGDGRILLAAARLEPNATCVGVDKAIAAHLAASIAITKAGKPKNIKLLRKNFFSVNLSDATHVFGFLYPGAIVKDLERKFQAELMPGARVVMCDFKLPNTIPAQTIPISTDSKFGKTLFVYEY